MNPVIDLIKQHSSVREYSDKNIPNEQLLGLIECGQAAASSSFIQVYSIIRVENQSNRKTIAEAAGGQPWIIHSAEFLVICADLKRIDYCCQKSEKGTLEGYAEHFVAATVDAALMAQNLLLAAESEGLGGVFIGGIRNAPEIISDLLELPELVYPVFGLCLGWPAQRNSVKPRMPVRMILHQDKYQSESIRSQVDEYDRLMQTCYASRQENARQSTWSEQTASAIQGKKRVHMLAFLQARGFIKL